MKAFVHCIALPNMTTVQFLSYMILQEISEK